MKTEVAIIGAGVVGCSAAYHLAKKGFQVLVIEKDPDVGRQASGRAGGGVRQHSRKGSLLLAMESVKFWKTLQKELNADLEYEQVGNLKITFDEANVEFYERDLNYEHEHGLMDVKLLTSSEAHAMIPGLTNKVAIGKFCPSDGIANPMLVSPAFASAGKKLGVQFQFNTTVSGYLKQGDTVRGVQTSEGEIRADFVINAAGAWAGKLNSDPVCPVIIGPGNSQLLVTERMHHIPFSNWLTISEIGYIRPTKANNLVIGSAGSRNDDYDSTINIRSASIETELLAKQLPWMGGLKIIRAFSGITEYTPDTEPYIGAVPGSPGLLIAAGFHGEGFCTGPMAGKILADLIDGKESVVSLEPFRPDRFASDVRDGNAPRITYPFENQEKLWNRLLAKNSITY